MKLAILLSIAIFLAKNTGAAPLETRQHQVVLKLQAEPDRLGEGEEHGKHSLPSTLQPPHGRLPGQNGEVHTEHLNFISRRSVWSQTDPDHPNASEDEGLSVQQRRHSVVSRMSKAIQHHFGRIGTTFNDNQKIRPARNTSHQKKKKQDTQSKGTKESSSSSTTEEPFILTVDDYSAGTSVSTQQTRFQLFTTTLTPTFASTATVTSTATVEIATLRRLRKDALASKSSSSESDPQSFSSSSSSQVVAAASSSLASSGTSSTESASRTTETSSSEQVASKDLRQVSASEGSSTNASTATDVPVDSATATPTSSSETAPAKSLAQSSSSSNSSNTQFAPAATTSTLTVFTTLTTVSYVNPSATSIQEDSSTGRASKNADVDDESLPSTESENSSQRSPPLLSSSSSSSSTTSDAKSESKVEETASETASSSSSRATLERAYQTPSAGLGKDGLHPWSSSEWLNASSEPADSYKVFGPDGFHIEANPPFPPSDSTTPSKASEGEKTERSQRRAFEEKERRQADPERPLSYPAKRKTKRKVRRNHYHPRSLVEAVEALPLPRE